METIIKKKNEGYKFQSGLKPKKKSIQEYYELESKNESSKNLEFNEGIIEKTTKMMTIKQAFIFNNLADYVVINRYFEKGWRLYAEKEFRTGSNKVRIPDMVLLNSEKVQETIQGINVVPDLLFEVISENDSFKSFEYKLIEYFSAGVQCVWAIIPDIELVYAYSSPRHVVIYSDQQVCSAKPAIDFEIITSEIFKK